MIEIILGMIVVSTVTGICFGLGTLSYYLDPEAKIEYKDVKDYIAENLGDTMLFGFNLFFGIILLLAIFYGVGFLFKIMFY